jgi:hypothetical protein
MARSLAFYRCKASTDYPLLPDAHPASLAVRENRLLPHADAWLAKILARDQIEETARQVVAADGRSNREGPAISRARAVVECERKISRYLDGLEAGIAAGLIASRTASAQRDKLMAQAVLAEAPPAPEPLALEEVVETLNALRDLPELLATVDQPDRAALYQALGLTIICHRRGKAEEVKLQATILAVDLRRVGGGTWCKTPRRIGGPSLWLPAS